MHFMRLIRLIRPIGLIRLMHLTALWCVASAAFTAIPALAEEISNPAASKTLTTASVAINAAANTNANANANTNVDADQLPYTVERFTLPGPVMGVAVKVDLADPRVKVQVALADNRASDGDGLAVGRLDTPSQVARKFDFDITLNASYFAAPLAKFWNSKKTHYFVGNGAYPVGWHFSDQKLIASPINDKLRATMIVHKDSSITIENDVKKLPANTQFAVSGNAMMLTNGEPTPPAIDAARNPRSAVGLSANGKTLILVAVDGRSDKSIGVTLTELANICRRFGAANAINLDGGGSTAMVIKDHASGVYAIANQPSDTLSHKWPIAVERPVVDVIGIRLH